MSNLRYIAMFRSGPKFHVMSSSRGAESIYDTPGKARRYAGKDGKVLLLDLDLLPEVKS